METSAFEKIDGAKGVHFKIESGNISGLVVGGLSGAVNDQVEGMGAEKLFECGAIANIDFVMSEVASDLAKTVQIPAGVAGLAEEDPAHVVVDAVDGVALAIEMFDGFGADQAAGAGDENGFCLHQ